MLLFADVRVFGDVYWYYFLSDAGMTTDMKDQDVRMWKNTVKKGMRNFFKGLDECSADQQGNGKSVNQSPRV